VHTPLRGAASGKSGRRDEVARLRTVHIRPPWRHGATRRRIVALPARSVRYRPSMETAFESAARRRLFRSGGRCALLLPVVLLACSPSTRASLAADPTTSEQRLLSDPASRSADPLLSAVIVGGPRDPAELDAMTRSLDGAIRALLQGPPALPDDPAARASAVLERLFSSPSGQPLLRQYDADATTLHDVVATGRFNCVSATMLYILAARRVGIDARPVLLPSHARALVMIGGKSFVVETTTAHGFDPPASVSREALDRARPKGLGAHVDLYADERGTEVDWSALLGIAYGNLGIMAQARGDTALAAALLARELTLTPPAQAPLVKAQQASLLTELATRALREGHFADALALALRADAAAPDARTRQLTEQNLAAIASQQLTAEGGRMDDATLVWFAEPLRAHPTAYGDVRALALTMLGQRRLKRGDVEGSSAALREAATVASSSEVRGQAGHNARLGELNRLGRLSGTDPESAWKQWLALGPPDPALGSTEPEIALAIAQNRAIHFANDGQCTSLEAVLTSKVSPIPREAQLRASCHAHRGITLSEHGDLAGALTEMRAAVHADPTDPHHKQNLEVVLEKEIDRLVHAGGCAQIPPLVAEGQAIAPEGAFFAQATEYCRATAPQSGRSSDR